MKAEIDRVESWLKEMEIEVAMLEPDQKEKVQPLLRELRVSFIKTRKEFKIANKSFNHE
jgi:hypothetical protein